MNFKRYLTNKYYVIAIAVFCCILWGSAFPVLKVSYSELRMLPNDMSGKIVLAGIRFLIAAIMIFLLLIVFMKKSVKITKKQLKTLLILGILQTSLQYFFFYNGLAHTSAIKGAVLSSITSFFVVILAHFKYKDDKINWRKTLGLITGFGGIIVANWGKGKIGLDFSLNGEGFLIFSGIVGAFGTIIAKELSRDIHPFVVTAWQMLLGSILLIISGIPGFKEGAITFTSKGWILILYSSFLSAAAFSLWYALLKYNKAGDTAIYKFIIPVAGAILSVIFIKEETFSLNIILALLLVVMGIVGINYSPRKKEQ